MKDKIHIAPEGTGRAETGKTLPGLLWEADTRHTNDHLLNQRDGNVWRSISIDEFKKQSTQMAVGLKEMGINRGDRIALFMESDIGFCVADMACLIAGFIDIPIYLTHTQDIHE